ncbi:RDD family protein [Kitasatospora viridis]|uniref:Putative RDD family membrane protein YckC n=1 Tax=Kitasatospora viridis TaxID=281105 RepID=A0A561UJP7_9ACTN|nr:RDD family protein [Kitasatospora viridis]TWF99566.1 putative RDD family membrane protein YckC [Kitasatospora viridis]
MSNPYEQYPDPTRANSPQPQAPALADWPLRVGSALIDGLIIAVPFAIAYYAIAAALGFLILLAGVVGFGYLEGTTGQTPGKRVVGLRTVRLADGALLGAGLGIARRLAHVVDGIPCYVGYLWPLWDAKRQTFADKIVSSVVIRVQ